MEISKHGKHVGAQPHHLPASNANLESAETRGNGEIKQVEGSQSSRLLEKLQGNTEVRNRLLVEIQAKYLAGEYATRTAVEKAAEQIVGF